MKSNIPTFAILLATLFLSGCSDFEKFPLAPVTGIVLCEGEPVPYVQVHFHPAPEGASTAVVGKAGYGVTDEKGAFHISTYKPGDGAIIGKHEIRIGVSRSTLPDCPADLSYTGVWEIVEVVKGKGKNEFTFTLPKRNPRQQLVLNND